MSAELANIRIELVSRAERAEVLAFLLRDWPDGARAERAQLLQAEAMAGRIDLDGLLAARRDDDLVGCCWCQAAPGRLATIWPPVIAEAETDELAIALIDEAVAVAVSRGARLAKALVVDPIGRVADWYRPSGFEHLTDRVEMTCLVNHAPKIETNFTLDFNPYAPADHARFSRIVERTYVDSQDCPQLNGLRKVNDVLGGYRATGELRPEYWLIARHEQQDVGCVIITDYPREKQCELLYMGLAPEYRGRGFGHALVRRAQSLARSARRDRLVLAVDAENQSAIKTYLAAGFVEVERQAVMVRALP